MRLVLASASPRRADLLRAAGFRFEIVPPEVDEAVRDAESAADYVRRLAREKSSTVWTACLASGHDTHDLAVLGADTAVVVDGAILGKPADDREAASMLRRLSGRRHEVLTGVCVSSAAGERELVAATSVYVSDLSEVDIAWYVASSEGRDKAGAYAIQGLASRFIPRIEGSYSNVVGLPVDAVSSLLSALASGG